VKLKDNFVGTGPLKRFAEESNRIFSALNNATVKMPSGYDGGIPTLSLKKSGESASLVLDMSDAMIFNPQNVTVSKMLGSTGNLVIHKISVDNGHLNVAVLIT